MPPALSTADQAAPITTNPTAVIADARRVAERLTEAVATVVSAIPPEHRTAAGIARWVGVERTIVQRLISGTASQGPASAELLTRIPSPKAIMSIADALLAADCPDARDLREAAEQLNALILRHGGTQKAFTQALQIGFAADASVPTRELQDMRGTHPASDDPHLARRASQFRNARELTRSWASAWLDIDIIAPSRTRPDRADIFHVRGVSGYRAYSDAVPLVFSYTQGTGRSGYTDNQTILPLSEAVADGTQSLGVLERFCSDPIPKTSVRSSKLYVTYIVEPSADQSEPIDMLFALHLKGISTLVAPGTAFAVDEVWAAPRTPSEGFIFDSYLHRSMARQCIPGLDQHLWSVRHDDPLSNDRWATRLRGSPSLIVLGSGLEKASSPLYARQRELTAEAFRRMGYSADDFVGFRCEQRFPEWQVGYRMHFDYRDTPNATS